jgi:nitrate/nitrite transport system permease protein
LFRLLVFTVFVLVWHIATLPTKSVSVNVAGMTAEQIEYQKMMGKDAAAKKPQGFQHPLKC